MNPEGNYFLWSGVGAIEEIEDATPIIGTSHKALDALKAKTEGHWTLWLREGYRAILVATWIPKRNALTLLTIDVSELEGPPTTFPWQVARGMP